MRGVSVFLFIENNLKKLKETSYSHRIKKLLRDYF
jgi:hypothetical protein